MASSKLLSRFRDIIFGSFSSTLVTVVFTCVFPICFCGWDVRFTVQRKSKNWRMRQCNSQLKWCTQKWLLNKHILKKFFSSRGQPLYTISRKEYVYYYQRSGSDKFENFSLFMLRCYNTSLGYQRPPLPFSHTNSVICYWKLAEDSDPLQSLGINWVSSSGGIYCQGFKSSSQTGHYDKELDSIKNRQSLSLKA